MNEDLKEVTKGIHKKKVCKLHGSSADSDANHLSPSASYAHSLTEKYEDALLLRSLKNLASSQKKKKKAGCTHLAIGPPLLNNYNRPDPSVL